MSNFQPPLFSNLGGVKDFFQILSVPAMENFSSQKWKTKHATQNTAIGLIDDKLLATKFSDLSGIKNNFEFSALSHMPFAPSSK